MKFTGEWLAVWSEQGHLSEVLYLLTECWMGGRKGGGGPIVLTYRERERARGSVCQVLCRCVVQCIVGIVLRCSGVAMVMSFDDQSWK